MVIDWSSWPNRSTSSARCGSRPCTRSRPRFAGSGCAWTCRAKPPVWRRLELPGGPDPAPAARRGPGRDAADATATCTRFRTGRDHRSPYFVTTIDVERGRGGPAARTTSRLDRLLSREWATSSWYDYGVRDGRATTTWWSRRCSRTDRRRHGAPTAGGPARPRTAAASVATSRWPAWVTQRVRRRAAPRGLRPRRRRPRLAATRHPDVVTATRPRQRSRRRSPTGRGDRGDAEPTDGSPRARRCAERSPAPADGARRRGLVTRASGLPVGGSGVALTAAALLAPAWCTGRDRTGCVRWRRGRSSRRRGRALAGGAAPDVDPAPPTSAARRWSAPRVGVARARPVLDGTTTLGFDTVIDMKVVVSTVTGVLAVLRGSGALGIYGEPGSRRRPGCARRTAAAGPSPSA